jgi:hypothetical protein
MAVQYYSYLKRVFFGHRLEEKHIKMRREYGKAVYAQ